jgi:shikimate kinase
VYFSIYGKKNSTKYPMIANFSNIILIGMAGAGKSTIGRVLAGLSGKCFLDTDDLITARMGMALQDFLDRAGSKRFQQLEEQTLLDINPDNHIIATGGSAIYSDKGMAHLQTTGPLVLLEVDLATLKQRVNNENSRGLVNPDSGSFSDLYYARRPLYRKWADYRIPASSDSPEDIARAVLERLHKGAA